MEVLQQLTLTTGHAGHAAGPLRDRKTPTRDEEMERMGGKIEGMIGV